MPHDPEDMTRPTSNFPTGEPSRPDPVARSLAALTPSPTGLNRDRLMFEAGAASRISVIRLWQAAAGFLAAVGFAAGMYFRPPSVVERVVYVEPPPVMPARTHPSEPPTDVVPADSGTRLGTPITPKREPSESEPTVEATLPGPDLPEIPYGLEIPRWLQVRQDVLSVGLGVLPDSGPRFGPPTQPK